MYFRILDADMKTYGPGHIRLDDIALSVQSQTVAHYFCLGTSCGYEYD